jgi:hypothetical protein
MRAAFIQKDKNITLTHFLTQFASDNTAKAME